MPIGTSDGKYFEDEVAYQRSHFQFNDINSDGALDGVVDVTSRAAPNGLPIDKFRRSTNVEDYRDSPTGRLSALLAIPRPSDIYDSAKEALQHPLTSLDTIDTLPPNELSKQAGVDDIKPEASETSNFSDRFSASQRVSMMDNPLNEIITKSPTGPGGGNDNPATIGFAGAANVALAEQNAVRYKTLRDMIESIIPEKEGTAHGDVKE